MKTLFLSISVIISLCSCKQKTSIYTNENKIKIVEQKSIVEDTIYYDFYNSYLSFTVICIDTIPYSHLIILNAGKGINEHIDFADNEKSFFDHRDGNIKMLSYYFDNDTVECKYKIYNDTLEWSVS